MNNKSFPFSCFGFAFLNSPCICQYLNLSRWLGPGDVSAAWVAIRRYFLSSWCLFCAEIILTTSYLHFNFFPFVPWAFSLPILFAFACVQNKSFTPLLFFSVPFLGTLFKGTLFKILFKDLAGMSLPHYLALLPSVSVGDLYPGRPGPLPFPVYILFFLAVSLRMCKLLESPNPYVVMDK